MSEILSTLIPNLLIKQEEFGITDFDDRGFIMHQGSKVWRLSDYLGLFACHLLEIELMITKRTCRA
jgi:hypothetical protein